MRLIFFIFFIFGVEEEKNKPLEETQYKEEKRINFLKKCF